MNTVVILKLVDLAAMAITQFPALQARFDGARAVSEAAKAENRDPTPEEWAALDRETESLIRDIRNA